MLVTPAAPQTRNTYRDILAASFDYAVREGWLDANPLASVKRASKRHDHDRILRRDDFYDPDEINRLLHHAPSVFEEAFWLCGAHAGLRLPGEALGLRWGAVDFQTGVMRPYDNWVRNEMDTTKCWLSEVPSGYAASGVDSVLWVLRRASQVLSFWRVKFHANGSAISL
jgi:integrase